MRTQAIALIFAALPALSQAQRSRYSGFPQSCGKPELTENNTVLKTTCCFNPCVAGNVVENELDLNNCVGVDDEGKLVFAAGYLRLPLSLCVTYLGIIAAQTD